MACSTCCCSCGIVVIDEEVLLSKGVEAPNKEEEEDVDDDDVSLLAFKGTLSPKDADATSTGGESSSFLFPALVISTSLLEFELSVVVIRSADKAAAGWYFAKSE